jgi:hypothetical protein
MKNRKIKKCMLHSWTKRTNIKCKTNVTGCYNTIYEYRILVGKLHRKQEVMGRNKRLNSFDTTGREAENTSKLC